MAGWSATDCERYAPLSGRCGPNGQCVAPNDVSYCSVAVRVTIASSACADTACRRPNACQTNSFVNTSNSVALNCFSNNEPGGCASGSLCGAGGKCLKANGQMCFLGVECATGVCAQGRCCNEQCGAAPGMSLSGKLRECFRCDLAAAVGVCTIASARLCGVVNGTGSTDCRQYLAGWVGSQCHRYTAFAMGVCDTNGNCNTLPTHCQAQLVPTAAKVGCAVANCADSNKCLPLTNESSVTTPSSICKSGPDPGCGVVDCAATTFGWNNNQCLKYGPSTTPGIEFVFLCFLRLLWCCVKFYLRTSYSWKNYLHSLRHLSKFGWRVRVIVDCVEFVLASKSNHGVRRLELQELVRSEYADQRVDRMLHECKRRCLS